MAASFLRKRTLLVLPAVLLTVSLLQDVVAYKVRQHVHDLHARVAIVLVLYGVAFSIAADWITPWIKDVLVAAQSRSRRSGTLGLLLYYGVAYGILYYAYFVSESRGVRALLPAGMQ